MGRSLHRDRWAEESILGMLSHTMAMQVEGEDTGRAFVFEVRVVVPSLITRSPEVEQEKHELSR